MTLDDEFNEDQVISSDDGRFSLVFETFGEKEQFLSAVERMVRIHDRNTAEDYRCGHCAAYPCFRSCSETSPAGLCFQATRRCRQECDYYHIKDIDGNTFPANGGFCKVDKLVVSYNQDCHIPSMQKQKDR